MNLPYKKLTKFASITYPLRYLFVATSFILTLILRSRFILVVGMSRSGTTLLGKILSVKNSSDYIHEPVKHLVQKKWEQEKRPAVDFKSFDFWSYAQSQQLSWFKLHALVVTALYLLYKSGKRDRTYIMKLIAMTHFDLYKWAAHFLRAPVIFILRHPCGRSESLLRQAKLDRNEIIDSLSTFEKWGDRWASTHRRVQHVFEHHPKWIIVKFEELCAEPIKKSKQIYAQLGLKWNSRVEKEIRIMTNTDSDEFYGVNRVAHKQIDKWESKLKSEQIEAIRKGTLKYGTKLYEGF